MSDAAFTTFIEAVLGDVLSTVESTAERAAQTGLCVGKLELQIPAFVEMTNDQDDATRLRVALPSLRQSIALGTLGRITMTIGHEEATDVST